MDNELLISLVERHQELYDPKHIHYYDDVHRRNKIWKEIGKAMQRPGLDCKERWTRIRENYRRALKLRQNKSSGKNFKDPKYNKILSFINPYLDLELDTDSNMPDEDSAINTDDDNFTETSKGDEREYTNVSTRSKPVAKKKSSQYKIHIRPRPKQNVVESTPNHSLFQERVNVKNSSNSNKDMDPVVAFFQNLGQTVKSFPEHIQVRVKREVFKIVNKAEEEVCMMKSKTNPGDQPLMSLIDSLSTTSHNVPIFADCSVVSNRTKIEDPQDTENSMSE